MGHSKAFLSLQRHDTLGDSPEVSRSRTLEHVSCQVLPLRTNSHKLYSKLYIITLQSLRAANPVTPDKSKVTGWYARDLPLLNGVHTRAQSPITSLAFQTAFPQQDIAAVSPFSGNRKMQQTNVDCLQLWPWPNRDAQYISRLKEHEETTPSMAFWQNHHLGPWTLVIISNCLGGSPTFSDVAIGRSSFSVALMAALKATSLGASSCCLWSPEDWNSQRKCAYGQCHEGQGMTIN